MGLASLEWKDLKKLIGDSKIIDMMKGYDKDKVSPAILRKLKPIVTQEGMQYDVLRSKSAAAANLSLWVQGIYRYAMLRNQKWVESHTIEKSTESCVTKYKKKKAH